MQRSEKEQVVAELTERLNSAQALIVADYRGLTNSELEGLRAEVARLRDGLEHALQEARDARAKAEESDRARVRAEATSDTLREVLDSLRSADTDRGN